MALGAQRSDAPSSWSATACRACRTPTSRASPRRAPRGTSWSTGVAAGSTARRTWSALLVRRRGRGRPGHRRRGRDTADRAEPPSCTFVAAVVDGPPSSPAGSATRGSTGCPTRAPPLQLSVDDSGAQRADRARRAAGQGGGVAARRTPSPAGSVPTPTTWSRAPAPRGRRDPAGCSSARTACGTTAPRPTDVADLLHRTVAAGRDRAGRRSRPSWCAGRTQQGGRDNITAALARVAAPVDTVHTDEAVPADAGTDRSLIEEPQWPSSAPRCSRTSSSPTAPPTCTRSSR